MSCPACGVLDDHAPDCEIAEVIRRARSRLATEQLIDEIEELVSDRLSGERMQIDDVRSPLLYG